MKYYLLALLMLVGCTKNPPCPKPGPNDKPIIFSEELGSVNIDGEECKIFQTYQQFYCSMRPGEMHEPYSCDGEFMDCSSPSQYSPRVLTRITKCPSGITVNGITHTPDKFHKEKVE